MRYPSVCSTAQRIRGNFECSTQHSGSSIGEISLTGGSLPRFPGSLFPLYMISTILPIFRAGEWRYRRAWKANDQLETLCRAPFVRQYARLHGGSDVSASRGWTCRFQILPASPRHFLQSKPGSRPTSSETIITDDDTQPTCITFWSHQLPFSLILKRPSVAHLPVCLIVCPCGRRKTTRQPVAIPFQFNHTHMPCWHGATYPPLSSTSHM